MKKPNVKKPHYKKQAAQKRIMALEFMNSIHALNCACVFQIARDANFENEDKNRQLISHLKMALKCGLQGTNKVVKPSEPQSHLMEFLEK